MKTVSSLVNRTTNPQGVYMRVYRWEHMNRCHGPLCAAAVNMGAEWWKLFNDHADPCDFDDFNIFWNSVDNHQEYFFGWSSLDLLISNLKKESEDKLEELGYVLREYESADYICLPDGQVVFHLASAKRIN